MGDHRQPSGTFQTPGDHFDEQAAETAMRGPAVIKRYQKTLPSAPGVYRMLDQNSDVLYVGKARNLKNRVTSYTKFGGHTHRIAQMIAATAEMDFITTQTETEALLLEANLIKRLKPRYNVIMRDDKSFPYILLKDDHDFPQVLKYRGARSQPGRYFGPFASAGAVNRTLNTLQRAFLLRSCSDSVFDARTRPCLLYQIKRCSAPCVDYISKEDYAKLVHETNEFLSGKSTQTQSQLSKLMEDASAALDFERAAGYRDRIKALTAIQTRQAINPENTEEADVFAAYADGGQVCIQVFFFRARQNWGNRAYFPRHDKSDTIASVLDSFLAQFYENKEPPKLILISEQTPEQSLLSEALSIRSDRKIEIGVPKRGERKDLIEHSLKNARDALARRLAESKSQRQLMEGVAKTFRLEEAPSRIEVYDNSHIQGTNAVGGMIVAGPEGFQKNQYRKFNIKSESLAPGDDYAMMREVLRRRFSRLNGKPQESEEEQSKEDVEKFGVRPDLVLIDGGPGQLSSASEIMEELGLSDIPLVGIAKGVERNAGREHFYMTGRAPFMLEPKSPVLYYLQRLRDEAHRFAIGGHRARRKKSIRTSTLDDVPGIGAQRKRSLLNHFGSARAVKSASPNELAGVEGISKAMATRIYNYFHEDA